MSIYQGDSKRIVKFNFVTLCFVFLGFNPNKAITYTGTIPFPYPVGVQVIGGKTEA